MRPSGPWVTEKLDYLHRYIDLFEKSMRNKWLIRNYIDLMAGPGKNLIRETKQILLGSPLIALTTQFPFTGYYFIDIDPANTSALQERCKASPLLNSIHIETGDCNVIVNQVVKQISSTQERSLNLAFLDPEGLELEWSSIKKLAGIKKMDFVINYPEGGLNRMMAKVYRGSNDDIVDLFFGTQDWRKVYNRFKNQHKSGLHRDLIDLYKSQLQSLGYVEIKGGDDAGGNEPLIRNAQRNAPLYRLIFASKNPLGEKFWRSITKRDVYGQRRLLDSL
jgi:three-Cys-motif partner protein